MNQLASFVTAILERMKFGLRLKFTFPSLLRFTFKIGSKRPR